MATIKPLSTLSQLDANPTKPPPSPASSARYFEHILATIFPKFRGHGHGQSHGHGHGQGHGRLDEISRDSDITNSRFICLAPWMRSVSCGSRVCMNSRHIPYTHQTFAHVILICKTRSEKRIYASMDEFYKFKPLSDRCSSLILVCLTYIRIYIYSMSLKKSTPRPCIIIKVLWPALWDVELHTQNREYRHAYVSFPWYCCVFWDFPFPRESTLLILRVNRIHQLLQPALCAVVLSQAAREIRVR
jgi:hypothetical protein